MQSFITGLQFLSRIRFIKQTTWSDDAFSKSVRYFPLVGAVVGAVLAAAAILFNYLELSLHCKSALLLVLWIYLGGGLTCDGFMDTMDGVFSGRDRARMLEIMKDSRVGANGMVGFMLLCLLKWSVLIDMPADLLPIALFLAPILGKLAMVIGIVLFPYARPVGIGKMFKLYANGRTLAIAAGLTILCLIPFAPISFASAVPAVAAAMLMGKYVTGVLGGLTGDVYGAITEVTEAVVLVSLIGMGGAL